MEGGIIVNVNDKRIAIPYNRMAEIIVRGNKDLVITIIGEYSPALRRTGAFESQATGYIITDTNKLTLSVCFPSGTKEHMGLIKHLNAEFKDKDYGNTWY